MLLLAVLARRKIAVSQDVRGRMDFPSMVFGGVQDRPNHYQTLNSCHKQTAAKEETTSYSGHVLCLNLNGSFPK